MSFQFFFFMLTNVLTFFRSLTLLFFKFLPQHQNYRPYNDPQAQIDVLD